MDGGYEETLYCDKLKFDVVCGVESGVCFSEGLYWSSGDVGGEDMGDIEELCVVFGW